MEERVLHYRLIRALGAGGMGEVHLAEDTRLERPVALKFLSRELARQPDHRRRFLAEARAASALNHPNVCIVHEVGETEAGRPFMAMEFVEGKTLETRLEAGTPSVDELVDIAIQVTDALEAAHDRGIVHRDIKPANIKLNERGQVKVLDFGLAKRVGGDARGKTESVAADVHTRTGTVLGTPVYMSPEQALGRSIDPRSDLFSVGVVLYQLATARLPFSGSSFGEVVDRLVHGQPEAMARFNYDIPPELERVTRKCLEKDPARRYQSARDLLVDLKNLRRDLAGEDRERGGIDAGCDTIALEAGEVAPVSPGAAAESLRPTAPPPEELRESDIFITYAHVDDEPLSPGKQGWISQFHRNLEVRVEQLSGERVRIARHANPTGAEGSDPNVLEQVPGMKTLVSVVSPPFIKSEGCRREVEEFVQSAEQSGNLEVASKSRVFKVVKRPVSVDEMPPRLAALFSNLLDFDFYEVDPESGRLREFDDVLGQTASLRYHERVYDLAREITQVLRALRDDAAASPTESSEGPGRTVYLATTTSDLEPHRDRIRRELGGRGHTVLPDRPLPLVGSELEETVRGLLERSTFAIHPVGRLHGVVPEGSEHSILQIQNRLAAARAASSGLERVIWIPRGLEATDSRQEKWVRALKEDPDEHRGADVIRDSLESLKEILVDRLAARRESESSRSAGGPPRVYLICDRRDESAIEALEDFLFDRGLEVSLPDFEAEEAEAAETHRRNLTDCDGVIIYYGAARNAWVDIKLRGLLKAAGYGRSREMSVKAVYVAPPFDRRKERFRTHTAEVIRQGEAFDPGLLEPLVSRLKKTRGNGHG